MATAKEFCDGMNKVYENHGVYIGTDNEEKTCAVLNITWAG